MTVLWATEAVTRMSSEVLLKPQKRGSFGARNNDLV